MNFLTFIGFIFFVSCGMVTQPPISHKLTSPAPPQEPLVLNTSEENIVNNTSSPIQEPAELQLVSNETIDKAAPVVTNENAVIKEVVTIGNKPVTLPSLVEMINNGATFSVTNPVESTCYFRLTKSNGSQHIFKSVRASVSSSIQSYLGCGHFAPQLNLCRDHLVRVEIFSKNNTICNFGVTSPQNGDYFPLSLERGIQSGIFIHYCGINQECFEKKRVKLVKRGKNKFEFTTSDNGGFQGHFVFENNNAPYYGTSGMSNSGYVSE